MAPGSVFALGVIVSLCFIPGITGAAIPTQYAVLSAVLPFTLWRQGQFTIFHGLGAAFLLYAAVSLSWSGDIYGSVYGLWLVCIMALTFWLGSTLQTLRGVYAGLAVGGIASSAVAVLQTFGYDLLATAGGHPPGIFFNSVAQGEILALLAIALVTENMIWQAMLLAPGIVLSYSRGAWLALGVGLIALHVRSRWLLAIIATAGVVFWFVSSPSDVLRLWIWTAACNEMSFFGNGTGSFASQLYSNGVSPVYPEYVHNDALQLVYEYGIAAALPFCIFAFVLSRTKEREWPVVLAFAVMALYSFPLFMAVTSFVGLLVAGHLVRSWAMDGIFRDYRGPVLAARQRRSGSAVVSVVG